MQALAQTNIAAWMPIVHFRLIKDMDCPHSFYAVIFGLHAKASGLP
jgi:hypothetical protein